MRKLTFTTTFLCPEDITDAEAKASVEVHAMLVLGDLKPTVAMSTLVVKHDLTITLDKVEYPNGKETTYCKAQRSHGKR